MPNNSKGSHDSEINIEDRIYVINNSVGKVVQKRKNNDMSCMMTLVVCASLMLFGVILASHNK